MKKIANGRLYNTETAAFIDEFSFSLPGDFNYVREILYRKKTGEFFLYAAGGANSRYARKIGQHTWAPDETILPLSDEEAMGWMEEHGSADDYIALFGEPEE